MGDEEEKGEEQDEEFCHYCMKRQATRLMIKLLTLLLTLFFLVANVHSDSLHCGSHNRVNYRKNPPPVPGIEYTNAKVVPATSNFYHLLGKVFAKKSHPIIIKFRGKTLKSLSLDYVACGRPGGYFVLETYGKNNERIHRYKRKPEEWCGKDGVRLNKRDVEETIDAKDSHGEISSVRIYYQLATDSCHAQACWEALAIRELRYRCADD